MEIQILAKAPKASGFVTFHNLHDNEILPKHTTEQF